MYVAYVCVVERAAIVPESLAGAGDSGGAASLIEVPSDSSVASESDFLFKEPMAGFV